MRHALHGVWRRYRGLPSGAQVAVAAVIAVAVVAVAGARGGAPTATSRPTPATRPPAVTAPSASTTAPAPTAPPSSSPSPSTSAGSSPASPATSPAPGAAPNTCHARGSGLYVLPDPTCTPGATNPAVTQADIGSTICTSGWTTTIRPPESYTEPLKYSQLAAYGEPGPVSSYEEDHLIPLELGGAPRDVRNLWPEPGAAPNPKDEVENAARHAVCDGVLTLAAAQQAIATDWIALGRQLGVTTTAAAPATGPTAAPPPAADASPAPAPAPAATAGCSPTTPSGSCYRRGEYCSSAEHGTTGTDASGNAITCEDVSGTWRWE